MGEAMSVTQTDQELIQAVNNYMASHNGLTRHDIRKNMHTSLGRLELLEKAGHIKLPPKLTLSQAASKGRKKNNTLAGWYINKPSAWQ